MSLAEIDLGSPPATDFIDTPAAVSNLVDTLYGLPTLPPSLYIDLEGINLSRQGSISIFQIFVSPLQRTYLIDIHGLRGQAFTTPSTNGRTLKDLLESQAIPKVFFDVRNDSDALFSHFKINLGNIVDLQVMELATRTYPKRYLTGLAKCLERDATMSTAERLAWMSTKETGKRLFAPERGGSYEVFNERPLSDAIRRYCTQDVQFLPRLWSHYNEKLTASWKQRVEQEAKNRVLLSQSASYDGHGREKALAPATWDSL